MIDTIQKEINKINDKDSFITALKNISNIYQSSLDFIHRRNRGIFYTDIELASYLVKEIIKCKNITKDNISRKNFLEPCVGIGNFVFVYLLEILSLDVNMQEVINNVYVADIDNDAIEIYKLLLNKFCDKICGFSLSKNYFDTHIANGLLIKEKGLLLDYISIEEAFNINFKFDIVITNPPYKNLKADRKFYNNDEEYNIQKEYFNKISFVARNNFKYSVDGVINLYKLFVEDIIENYTTKDACITLLIPSTILSDKSCEELRDLVFKENTVKYVNNIAEANCFFGSSQALCSITLLKGKTTKEFKMCNNLSNLANVSYSTIDYTSLCLSTNSNIIIYLTKEETSVLEMMNKHRKLKNIDCISNLRGELDLTLYKNEYSSNKTNSVLIRGRDIGLFSLKTLNEQLYVSDDFVYSSSKKEFIFNPRIACQQVSNINKEKRLVFSYIPENMVLGNSCNFISVKPNNDNIDLYYLLGLFNSSLMNWYFKLRSSNNHINNYEIDDFPVPINNIKIMKEISALAKLNVLEFSLETLNKIDSLVFELFEITVAEKTNNKQVKIINESDDLLLKARNDLRLLLNLKDLNIEIVDSLINAKTTSDYQRILNDLYPSDIFTRKCFDSIIEKYRLLKMNCILNHTTFKLSDLDLEMVKCVKPGGNWKDIDQKVIEKSKRLVRINQTGGRTTLYGRIDYDKPCYTITTYFNRPGNGTYIHPTFDRVISVREAARIQSFDDSYYFVGNKSDYLKQIGNAVPPLLACEIAKSIKQHINIENSIDLFSGAGGLTSGIKKAGIKTVLAIDFEPKACITLKVNNPEINVICADLTKEETKNKIYQESNKRKIDLICGGPPCQGFSMAGLRDPNDPRNKLFIDYIDVLKKVLPKVFIMENVEGMKTMEKGEVYRTIINEFEKVGYKVAGKLLMANEYGVPQKRKRLITIGVRKDIDVNPNLLFPHPLNTIVTAKDAIKDLENIPCIENAIYSPNIQLSNYVKLLRE